jgi:hypothetical protein
MKAAKMIVFLFLLCTVNFFAVGDPISGFSPGFVEGHVFSEGKPLAGAKIDVLGVVVNKKTGKPSAYTICGEGFAFSTASGTYAAGVSRLNTCEKKKKPNYKYEVEVSKRGYISQKTFISFKERQIIQKNFILVPSNISIQVHVVGPGGRNIPYAFVILTKNIVFTNAKQILSTRLTEVASEAPLFRTDQNGMAVIPVSPGDYKVTAQKLGYQLATQNHNPLADAACKKFEQRALRFHITGSSSCSHQLYPGAFIHASAAGTVYPAVLELVPQTAPHFVLPKAYQQYLAKMAQKLKKEKTAAFIPDQFILIGFSRLSPNNVFFFQMQHLAQNSQGAVIGILRSNLLLSGEKIAPHSHLKFFNPLLYGYPSAVSGWLEKKGITPSDRLIYSFTDPTAEPGRTYYYYVGELPYTSSYAVPGKEEMNLKIQQTAEPSSNPVEVVTQK